MPTPENQETALAAALHELLGNAFVMYLRAHGAHWNVEGAQFHSLHDFFSVVYNDVFGSIDPIAEALRFHKFYAPSTLAGISRSATIPDNSFENGNPVPMLQDLIGVNAKVLESLFKVMPLADAAQDPGLSNFIQDRINMHNKWAWQLRSHLK